MGDRVGTVSALQILTPELDDEVLLRFLNQKIPQTITFHIEAVDQADAIRLVRRKLTDINQSKIDEQQKAVKAGYDMDVLPTGMKITGEKVEQLLESLGSRTERYFMVTVLFMQTAMDEAQLKEAVSADNSAAQECNCRLITLDYQQENGLISCLPIGINRIAVFHGLTTSALSIFVPFITKDFSTYHKGSAFCGMNKLTGKPIFTNRMNLKNYNGIILGTPGSGKSVSAKFDALGAFLNTDDDIIICDPESEYGALVKQLGGQVIHISPTSEDYINPMDIDLDADDPLRMKADFLLSLFSLLVGGRDGLKPLEVSIIDRCIPLVYAEYLVSPTPEQMPVLGDLYDTLLTQPEQTAKEIAAKLEIYIHGSMNVFNHRSNIKLSNRVVCFDCKDLGNQLKSAGMLMIQDTVWNRVIQNRKRRRATRYYVDEMHLLLHDAQTAAYMVSIWKRFRKWGGIPTGITQNVKDFLSSPEIKNIFENSDYVLMLNQAKDDQEILAKHLGMNTDQMVYVTRCEAGEGLLFYGDTVIPFQNHIPTGSKIYKIMTTRFAEVQDKS
ncbi:MAG: ATP-binding protein [Clostridia bacterium]|nr:ATP-binding protein [Clostridia bacterium]